MGKYVTNDAEIERRGGVVGSNSAFVVVACTSCARQYLYDEEFLQLYVKPADLAVRYLNTSDEPLDCLGCGTAEWDFTELDAESAEVAGGPWAWTTKTGSAD